MLNRILEDDFMSHMPFLTAGQNGDRVLVFCRADEKRIWKAHYVIGDGPVMRLDTGLDDDVCECSPTAWHDETGWHVSLIAGGKPENPLFHLFRMDGPALDRLSAPVAMLPTRTGFVHRDRLVYGDPEDLVHVRQPAGDSVVELPGATIYRVAYRADLPERLLVTGQWQKDEEFFTLEYDLATGRQHFIECDGIPAYKCTVLGRTVVYAERIGENFESRRLREAGSVNVRPANAAVRRLSEAVATTGSATAPKRCGCKTRNTVVQQASTPTRPSCLECVEKHLGAAYVLLAETADGYAHRLRAIGHFHEAEDESQEWPTLHAAIRAARKAYQTDGRIPNWEALGKLVQEVRNAR
jgi:hypothetical protein